MITKEKINQAGQRLINKESKVSQKEANLILQQFRFIHQHPMSLFRHMIERKLKKHKINTSPVQRLKRIPSIIKKLKIQKNMNLSRMQDIGGLRVVVDSMQEVDLIRNEIKKVERHGSFKFTFANEKNYVKNPPESGYRSIHMVYKYNKDIPIERQCRVEIQIRTKLQHSWSTAVEVLGTYLNQPLKQSLGNEEYLDIFKDISRLFVGLENKKVDYNLVKQVQKNIKSVKLFDKLQNFNIVSQHFSVSDNIQGQYVLLKMDFRRKIVKIAQYGKVKFEQANEDYLQMELDNFDDKAVEVVLLSIRDIEKLKQSYPNYFMDTTDFIENLQNLFEAVKKMQKLQDIIDNSEGKGHKKLLSEMLDSIFKNTLELFSGSKK